MDGEQAFEVGRQAPNDPEELEAAGTPPAEISPLAHAGPVHVTVSELERSLAYYRTTIGLELLDAGAGRASLAPAGQLLTLVEEPGARPAPGAGGRELLTLVEEPGARPAHGYTGLFHFALLVPARPDLARWLAHAARDRVRLDGLSDHAVSEAIYLSDPDGHGIEIYADRPRAGWEGRVGRLMTTIPLDVDDLLG